MENFEVEHEQTPQAQQEEGSADQMQPVCQTSGEPESSYRGEGVGHKEATFVNSAYATYHPNQQPYAEPLHSVEPAADGQKPQKQKKSHVLLWSMISSVATLVMVVLTCWATATICNRYGQQQNAILLQNMNEKVSALQQQIGDQKPNTEGSGSLQPGQTLTAAQIYEMNVHSVVGITTNRSSGTGFIISEDGYIVTNHHVIDSATRIVVTLADGTEYVCQLIGSDSTNDVALLKAKAVGLRPVTLGSSAAMKVGDQVVAIGNALGELSFSLTVGHVSGIYRDITTDGTVINMIQTDAAINSGNSGGPLFNARGEVIGITTAKYSGTTSTGAVIEGISFAIPLDDVIDMIVDLRDFGHIKSAYLGVLVWEVDAKVAATYNLPRGVYVEEATAGSCAEAAGVQAKDIIVELGGYRVQTMNDLSRALRNLEPGQTVTMIVWRAGQNVVLNITMDEKPAN